MEDKESPQFWRQLKPGSTISLSDTQALEDSMGEGLGLSARDYVVKERLIVRDLDALVEWILFQLQSDEDKIWFLVKMVEGEIALRVYFEAEGFEPGTRADLIENEVFWLFDEPLDPESFKCNELSYAREITQDLDEEQGKREIRFRIKGQGELHGACTHEPRGSWPETMMATIVEYAAEEESPNSELMILELGGEEGDEGGLITLLLGCEIRQGEVEVLAL